MAFRRAPERPRPKPDPVRRACLGLVYFAVLAVVAYGLFTLIDSRVQLRQVLELGSEIPDVVVAVVGSLVLFGILHLLVLMGTSIVRGGKTNGTRP